jgi:hypothetical protein
MWAALEKYQPYADADGHGKSWRVMCEERTQKAARAAVDAARAKAAWEAATAAWEATESTLQLHNLIKRIETAIKEREPMPSNIEPTSNDDGQPQTVDKPEPFDLNEAFRHTPQRQPLSDEQLREALRQCPHDTVENLRSRWLDAKYFARAIEKAHGIGGDK